MASLAALPPELLVAVASWLGRAADVRALRAAAPFLWRAVTWDALCRHLARLTRAPLQACHWDLLWPQARHMALDGVAPRYMPGATLHAAMAHALDPAVHDVWPLMWVWLVEHGVLWMLPLLARLHPLVRRWPVLDFLLQRPQAPAGSLTDTQLQLSFRYLGNYNEEEVGLTLACALPHGIHLRYWQGNREREGGREREREREREEKKKNNKIVFSSSQELFSL